MKVIDMRKKQFKAESKKLLDMMINSIYTHKEIFLRELISNASDATDKLYFKSLTDDSIKADKDSLKIRIDLDKENRTIKVSDNGIGMDKDELENNLGTIASSGSYKFRQQLKDEDKENVDIIGQFGVGFYSAFMVAKEITVITRKYGSDTGYKWQSAGADFVGAEDMIAKIQNEGWFGFDVMITTPDMMGLVGRLGKVLGPKGLMPNPKSGTVTMDIVKAINDVKAGKVEYRVDKTSIVHVPIGKKSFGPEKLLENFNTVMEALVKAKPAASKGTYLKSITIAATMGPGVKVIYRMN